MGKCGVQRGSTFPEAVATAGNLTLRSGRRVPAACSPRSSRGRRRLCVANSARGTPRRVKSAAAARQRCRVVSSQPLAVGGWPEREEPPTQAPGKASNNTVVCDDGCEDSRRDTLLAGGTASKKHQNEPDGVASRPRRRRSPPEAEMEAFFAAAEHALRRQFVETYNYDVALDRPLEGRFEWTPVSKAD